MMRVLAVAALVFALAACKRGEVEVIVDNQSGAPLEAAHILWEHHDVTIGTIAPGERRSRKLEPYTEQPAQVKFKAPSGEWVHLFCEVMLDDDARGTLVLTVHASTTLGCDWRPRR